MDYQNIRTDDFTEFTLIFMRFNGYFNRILSKVFGLEVNIITINLYQYNLKLKYSWKSIEYIDSNETVFNEEIIINDRYICLFSYKRLAIVVSNLIHKCRIRI